MRYFSRLHVFNSRTVKGLLAITSIVFLLNALPYIELPFILIQFLVAAFTDSVTGWDANSNFSDFTQVTSRAAAVGSIVAVLTAILMAVGICLLLYYKRARVVEYIDTKVEQIRGSRVKSLLLILIPILLASLFIMDQGSAALFLWT
jgi:hypothetical protein